METTTQWYEQEVMSATQGDAKAYTKLIEASMSMVTSIAMGIVRDLDASEDVAQQVYITIWQKLHSLKNPASFLPWVRQATRHAAYNYIRDNKSGNLFANNRHLNETEALLAQFKDKNSDLESSLNRQQQSVLIADLVSNLPEQSRDVVILYYREEQSTKQVAELLDLSEANVRQRLSRARSVLKEEWLSRYGKLILATLPPTGFAAMIGSSLTASSPLLAASSVVMLSGKISGLGKFLLLVGGAGIGILGGWLGIHFGIASTIKKSSNEKIKQQLLLIRKITLIGLLVTGLLFYVSSSFTQGWIWPVLTFLLYFSGITLYLWKLRSITYSAEFIKGQKKKFSPRYIFWSKTGGYVVFILSGTFGFGGLIAALIYSGRLVL